VLRCRVILNAIARRRLCERAAHIGQALRGHLRASGIDVWGVGLALWFNPETGGLQNATWFEPTDGGSHRLLPTLSFGGRDGEEVRQVVCRRGPLYSHLPAILKSEVAKVKTRPPPPAWSSFSELMRWVCTRLEACHPQAQHDRQPPSTAPCTAAGADAAGLGGLRANSSSTAGQEAHGFTRRRVAWGGAPSSQAA
jgi:hypothetical protein